MPDSARVPAAATDWTTPPRPSAAWSAVADFAITQEIDWSRDVGEQLRAGTFEPPPWNEILGPTHVRGGPAGIVLHGGERVAEWGDAARPDMTFSVAKSYLAVLAGIAHGDGLLRDVDEPVAATATDDGYASAQNRAITWAHLLQQTSEWEGTLFDKPDLVDRNRSLDGNNSRKGKHRDLQAPGRFWEYNDVRVNRLSLSLLQLFRRPLPQVLAERVMRPIGASVDWQWHGYRNSTVTVDGRAMTSVPGGSHWGGGLWISARDQARLGLMVLRGGRWGDTQVLSEDWVARMLTPCALKPDYGYLWWLNTARARYPTASERAYAAVGAGGNLILCEPERDLVLVARWCAPEATNELIARAIAACG